MTSALTVTVITTELSAARHEEALAKLRAAGSDPCPDCYTNRIDGACRPCALGRDPDYAAMCAARSRLDDGDYDSPEERQSLELEVAAFWRLAEGAERAAKTVPSACRWCGVEQREHCQSWVLKVGYHGWTEPTSAQRHARMLARRNVRLGRPAWAGLRRLGSERAA